MSTPGEVLEVQSKQDREGTAEELFRDVYPRLAGWVRRQVDDDGTAHEIAAEAFVRLLSRWTAVPDPHSYLYLVAADLLRGEGHRGQRRRWRGSAGSWPLRPRVPASWPRSAGQS